MNAWEAGQPQEARNVATIFNDSEVAAEEAMGMRKQVVGIVESTRANRNYRPMKKESVIH